VLERLIELIAGTSAAGLAAIAWALAFGETAIGLDLVVPGEAGMVVAGAAADSGRHPLILVVVAAALGAMAGDSLSFAIGRRWGMPLVERWPMTRRRLAPQAERASAWVERHGGLAVFAGRWIGAVRAVVPLVAGMSHMPVRRFMMWNALASVTWAGTAVTVGYVAGLPAARMVDRAGVWVYVAVAVIAAGLYLRSRRRARPTGGSPR
jgi:membrane protein DedA with SNARE-associated domain